MLLLQFVSRCYEFLKTNYSDFQCCAQLSFYRIRDQRHIVLNHFFKVAKKKEVAFYFSYLALCSICFLNLKGQHCVCVCVCECVEIGVWLCMCVFILCKEQSEAVLYKSSSLNNLISSICSVDKAVIDPPPINPCELTLLPF